MPACKLPNYLRLCRKRLGFSEDDIAFLLGVRHGSQVSRYEHFHRVPSLLTALAYHVIFRTSPPELFGGNYEKVERKVRARAKRLLRRLEAEPSDRSTARKLAWLRLLAGESEAPLEP
jgi:transcriptional regulator with XRE-family HTH domain